MPLASFINGYITCALWSSNDGEEPLDANHSDEDLAEETFEQMRKDCQRFYHDNVHLIKGEDFTAPLDHDIDSRAGHDFWLTRCGHGAGFWDGDWPKYGEALTEASKAFRSVDLYVGDDGKIYAM